VFFGRSLFAVETAGFESPGTDTFYAEEIESLIPDPFYEAAGCQAPVIHQRSGELPPERAPHE